VQEFVAAVVEAFGLGEPGGVVVTPMRGSANRLWRFDTRAGSYVVKEFSHDAPRDLARRSRAASFERRVFASGGVAMPEPVPARGGELVVRLAGSRGAPCAVRAHRWFDGRPVRSPGPDLLAAAGASLFRIQQAGASWSHQPRGSLRWWDVEPLVVAERLRGSSLADLGKEAAAVGADALAVVAAAEELEGEWVYSHCDHKPENALDVGGTPAVLDWDECGHCHRRLEVVEAALRWAGAAAPDRAAFAAFLDGYARSGGAIDSLSPRDFGKWIAALLGWFSFQGRRALGEWPSDTPDERDVAATMAGDAVRALAGSLSALTTWAGWY
jgi:Ser/Thr protein kinase RdoA (MazF antagonist)